MKEIDPTFDVWRLEGEAQVVNLNGMFIYKKAVFEDTYSHYLRDDISILEKVCGEQALAYFRV